MHVYKYSYVLEAFVWAQTEMILFKENHYNRTEHETNNMVYIGINRYA